ncbi:VOC family protein [Rhizobium sp. NFR03]|uniref:VOC family protein n=1 Tax=Rhizobium sp. NFR03 TaxID=1566263 RepID=UPI0008BBDC58|nr:VOC family protein [Rhizobium sp. NFR03]SES46737.1 catechol 2,3-dioxygenase [Rhizobium sp. NFR03]
MADRDVITFGAVHLEVRNVETTARFWESLFGFARRISGDSIELGTENETLIVLHGGATLPVGRGHSGLYHVAIHVPDQRDFARLLKRFSNLRYPCSPTDHTFSKAVYLDDPDGITIEVTLETPERFLGVRPVGSQLAFIGTDGVERPGSYPLDLNEIFQSYETGSEGEAAHPATRVGHIHLYVADLEQSREFYTGLGFELARWWPPMQIADFGAGGVFKHRIAINTWQGIGAPPHPPGMARMRYFELRYETVEGLVAAINGNPSATPVGAAHVLHDPSGIELRLVQA